MRSARTFAAVLVLCLLLVGVAAGTQAPVYSEDFSAGSSLAALGFNGPSPSRWTLDKAKQCMKSTTPGGAHRPARICTPAFQASRQDGQVTVEWKLGFLPDSRAANRRLQVALAGIKGNSLYTLSFTPDRGRDKHGGHDLALAKIEGWHAATLHRAATGRTIPARGRAWFRLTLNPPASAGGDGRIEVHYDAGDGKGFQRYISVRDETHAIFSKLCFEYTAQTGRHIRQACIDDIIVRANAAGDTEPPIYPRAYGRQISPAPPCTCGRRSIPSGRTATRPCRPSSRPRWATPTAWSFLWTKQVAVWWNSISRSASTWRISSTSRPG